jgi:hypothetical protein
MFNSEAVKAMVDDELGQRGITSSPEGQTTRTSGK